MRQFLFHVGGKPYFTIGGQFHNSSSHNDEMIERGFVAAKKYGFNTVAIPVPWYLLEPEEGTFDYSVVDRIVDKSRENGMHAVILWFGTWKNGTSHYVPAWVKQQEDRFRLVKDQTGREIGVLSPICKETQAADKKAFCKMMAYLKEINTDETVIGVQVENEPGSMGSPRDYSEEANALFAAEVPADVMAFVKNLGDCPIRRLYEAQGCPESGSWTEVFGPIMAASVFMAYNISGYIDDIAAAGKEIYDITMYVNVWLQEMHGQVPGVDYPSGGATTSMIDLWKWNTPHINAIAPDIYITDLETYRAVSDSYAREDNAFYVPESPGMMMNSLNLPYQIEKNGLCGIHVFGIDSYINENGEFLEAFANYARTAQYLTAAKPLLERTESENIKVYGVAQQEGARFGHIDCGDYILYVNYYTVPSNTEDYTDYYHNNTDAKKQRGQGLVFYMGNGEFYLAGDGFSVVPIKKDTIEHMTSGPVGNYALHTRNVRYLTIQEGNLLEDGTFEEKRYRCGDESDYGVWTTCDIGLVHFIVR